MGWIVVTTADSLARKIVLNTDHIVAIEPTELYKQQCSKVFTTLVRGDGGSVSYEVKETPDIIREKLMTA